MGGMILLEFLKKKITPPTPINTDVRIIFKKKTMNTHIVKSEDGVGVTQVINMTFQTKPYHFEICSCEWT